MDLRIGADPELFIKNKAGEFRSAWGLIPGNKEAPHKVDNGAIQVDGFAAEFNIDPATTKNEFVHNINSVMDTLRKHLPKDYETVVFASAKFDKAHYESLPEEALRLGCDPDYDAYTMAENPRPEPNGTTRSAGGHVHIGWTEGIDPYDASHFHQCCELVKQLDWYLYMPSVLIDKDKERRKMYGKPGSFRPKSYGLEYRVLSNFWVKDERLISWVFDTTKLAFKKLAMEDKSLTRMYGQYPLDVYYGAGDNLVRQVGEMYNLWPGYEDLFEEK